MEKYEFHQILNNLKSILFNLEQKIDVKTMLEQLKSFKLLMEKPNFWDNKQEAAHVTRKFSQLQNKINNFTNLQKQHQALTLLSSNYELNDTQNLTWLILELKKLQKDIKNLEIEVLLNQNYDENNAILMLHSGAGGLESQDWCEMLFRMYKKYAQKKQFQVEILNLQTGEEAGIKTVSCLIKGIYAYGYFKSERGIHRLVRKSPFDANFKRHTSFASCEVLPEINEEITVDIQEQDLRIDVFRSSGAGGQHVNTTDSAVRITHLPTGIVVNCQNERSQIRNKEKALQILKTKLFQLALQKQKEQEANLKSDQKEIGWGSQIRSYIFHPYQKVKDHRTNYESSQIIDIMDGELDDFINAFLRSKN
ncbi:MAG: peptide chain release factor 2 [Candidatus Phytoplasma australasiaticum]|nr:peptide chain release factor 2 [Candidatus Phytoplasma australasiaticum]MDV3199719.1 peptide chain release factor 2 [Candidatus Phytoplasma australasiaticum]